MSDIVEAGRKFREDVAPRIEAKLVKELNAGWETSVGDEQTYDDKREAITNELAKRYPKDSAEELEEKVEYMMENHVVRLLPFATEADTKRNEASAELLVALKGAMTAFQLLGSGQEPRLSHSELIEILGQAIAKAEAK